MRWISNLSRWKIGGFAWWKVIAVVAAGVIMAFGMGLRYGEPSDVWIPVAGVLIASVLLIWWSHVQMRDVSGDERDEDRPTRPVSKAD